MHLRNFNALAMRARCETFLDLYSRLYFIAILVTDFTRQILTNYYKLNKKAYIYVKLS